MPRERRARLVSRRQAALLPLTKASPAPDFLSDGGLRCGDRRRPYESSATTYEPRKFRRLGSYGGSWWAEQRAHPAGQRGLDFPLDGGYASVAKRTVVRSPYSEFGGIHEFTTKRRGEPATFSSTNPSPRRPRLVSSRSSRCTETASCRLAPSPSSFSSTTPSPTSSCAEGRWQPGPRNALQSLPQTRIRGVQKELFALTLLGMLSS